MTKQSRAADLASAITQAVAEFEAFVAACQPSVAAEDVRRPNEGVFLRYLDLLESRLDAEMAGRKCLNLEKDFTGTCVPLLLALAAEPVKFN